MPRRTLWILLAVLALAAALRFFRLDAQSFWNDEGTSARVAERSLPLITAAAIGDIHPPLYYYALHFWRGAWGESEAALRGLSAALGVLLVWLIYLLGRQLFDESTALVAAFIAALNPFQVYYSQEARMYVMLAVWAAASTCLLALWLDLSDQDKTPGLKDWFSGRRGVFVAGYVLTAAAGMYTHYAFPFVLIAHNLIAIGWLVTQTRFRRSPSFFIFWFAMQVAVVVLYLPWLGAALQRIPEWQSPAPAYQLGPALLDTFRWFVLGRTIPTEPTIAALGIVALFMLVSLWPTRGIQHAIRNTLLLLSWWLVPVGLIFVFGLYKEAYLKFLLASSPACCLLFARGIVTVWRAGSNFVPFAELGKGAGSPSQFWQAAILCLLILVAMPTFQSLSDLYLSPAFARDNYRGIAQRIRREERPGDAILLEAPNQWEVFTYYYRNGADVIPLSRVRPVTAEAAAGELGEIAAKYKRLFVLYWAETEPDPNRYVERWLNANTYKASEGYSGTVRMAVYAVPAAMSGRSSEGDLRPDHLLDAQFGDVIRLLGYSLMGETVAPGDMIQLALFWQAQAPIPTRYKVFVHVLDADDRIVAQVDREPGGGLVPTTIWQPGQAFIDRHGVAIPPDAAPGRYRVAVGLYGLDGARLGVRGTSADRVILGEVVVAR